MFLCFKAVGPVAQRLELTTHNRSVPGSNPGRPINMNYCRQHRGLSLIGILISLACVVVLMSIYLSSVQKAVTGGSGTSTETSLWGMQDQIQLQTLAQALTIYAMSNGDQFLVPSEVERTDDPSVNTSAYFWYLMIEQNLSTSKQLISPNDKGWVEEAGRGEFEADLESLSNVSYAHMPIFGERLKKRWRPTAGRFPILGNRGPKDGIEGTHSITLDADGVWRGWVVYADGSVEWQEGTTLTPKWRRRDGAYEDNLFMMEEEDSQDDAMLGFTIEMDDYGPIFVWD